MSINAFRFLSKLKSTTRIEAKRAYVVIFHYLDTQSAEGQSDPGAVSVVHTSMHTQEVVVGNGPRLCKCLELVQPLARDVELQQAGLHHAEQPRHPPTFLHRVLVALPVTQTD